MSSSYSLDVIYLQIGFGKFHFIVLLILGFIQFFDAVEMILLSFLGPILNCVWHTSMLQSSFITMAVFLGMMFGSTIFGQFSDKYGRKIIIFICSCGIVYFGLICAMSSTISWIIIIRLFIGMFIGGVSSTMMTFLSEIIPLNHRGSTIMSVQLFWSIGSYYITLLTVILIPLVGWRWWLVLSVAPMIVLIPFITWLPESPRYLLLFNRQDEVINIINYIAMMNNKQIRFSEIKNVQYKMSLLFDLCHTKYISTTIIITYISFVTGMSFYGLVLSSSIINNISYKCLQNMKTLSVQSRFTNHSIDDSCCFTQSWSTMQTVLLSIFGEFLSYVIAIILIRFIKRKIYLQILLLFTSFVYFLMNLCLSPVHMGLLMMFGRGASSTIYGVNYLYCSEVFPTSIRGFAIGFQSSFTRIGAMLSSFLVNILMLKISYLGGTMFFCIVNFVGFVLVFLLPYETKDRILLQSVDEDIPESELMFPK